MSVGKLNALTYTWAHGTKSLVVLYVLIAVFSLIGLARGKASARFYALWPAISC